MAIKIRFLSPLREVLGMQIVNLDSSFNTFEKVMDELIRLCPKLKDEVFYADGMLNSICSIMLNGKRLSWPKDKDIKVKGGDEFYFMIFMAGG